MKTKPPKAVRASQIATIIRIASDYFDADPMALYSHVQVRCPKAKKARAAVWVKMRECGWSCEDIGRVFLKGHDCVRIALTMQWGFSPQDLAMIASMPEVWSERRVAP